MLQEKTIAPDFTLCDAQGNAVSLHDFRGQKVVLYFYPKDQTPGCTKQACAFAAAYDAYRQAGIVVIGISKDSQRSHRNFIEKYSLPFCLLSDPECAVIQAYDVWKEKKLYGRTYMGVVRSTYLIDENGYIEKTFDKVSPDKNAQEILDYLQKSRENDTADSSY